MKNIFRKLLKAEPGKRFLSSYIHFNRIIQGKIYLRILALILAIVSFAVGIVLSVMPGPGILFILLGLILLSIFSRSVARLLDKIEKRFFLRKKQKP